jgi:hypothetical protein
MVRKKKLVNDLELVEKDDDYFESKPKGLA